MRSNTVRTAISSIIVVPFSALVSVDHAPTVQAEEPSCYEVAIATSAQFGRSSGRNLIRASVDTGSTVTQRVCSGDTPYGIGEGGPVAATGGGDGGQVACEVAAVGPVSKVQKVIRAVNEDRTPRVKDPSLEDKLPTAAPKLDQVRNLDWFRMQDKQPQVLHAVTCDDGLADQRWLTMSSDPDDPTNLVPIPQVRAIDLVPGLHSSVIGQLPTPTPRVGPADTNPNGWTFVQHPTFFWVDQGDGQWSTVAATASAGGISVTVSAEPRQLVIEPGDGGATVTCEGAPVEVTVDNYGSVDGCSYTYRHSSAMAPNGETYPVTAQIVWQVSWSANTGEGGDLGSISTTSATRWLAVAEIQAVITDTESG